MSVRSHWDGDRARRAARGAIRQALPVMAEIVLDASDVLVPDLTGAMQDSGGTDVEGNVASAFYEAVYAPFQHERMDLHHDDGQAKFLELGAVHAVPQVRSELVASLRAALAGGGR
ncbi:hypothetical protein PZ938_03120 [Luteipulveratus sp. YIM 133132]|uniref:hypothetical protein n=1 Tax=Luteipulveratus flavus TaxID=3031728 RepID=UPI0023B02B3B|nr:hypothetical protein [Luteipulveratus sp. YIM 133132]MDE9364584.1 hypothetical protein [Luteipulveratus sp. YIM 133132]